MQNGKVLLQKATNDTGFAFPGAHTASHVAASPATGFAFIIEITDESTQRNAVFAAKRAYRGGRNFDMEFYWVSADEISDLEIYPDNCKKFLLSHDGGLRHFIYKE